MNRWRCSLALLQLGVAYVLLSFVVFYFFSHEYLGKRSFLMEWPKIFDVSEQRVKNEPMFRNETFFLEELTFPCHESILQLPLPQSHGVPNLHRFTNYSEALTAKADANKSIVLLLVDSGYIDMALNIYRTSFMQLVITNYLFVCVDEQSTAILNAEGAGCFYYDTNHSLKGGLAKININSIALKKTGYGTDEFRQKTHIKTIIVLEALMLGYSVVICDVDIIFFKNPLPLLQASCSQCDIIMQKDGVYQKKEDYNSGFYLVKPTRAGLELHSRALELALQYKKLSNQKAIGKVLLDMLETKSIVLGKLNHIYFPNGMWYFEFGRRLFPTPCRESVIVHNNWIFGKKAKIHRFKAHVLWYIDTDKYYTSTENKYLVYGNPKLFGRSTIGIEIQALKNALFLGHILNRIVILPKFHCHGCNTARYRICGEKRCPIYVHLSIAHLDRYFAGAYREHSFFCHPWTPLEIKTARPSFESIANDYVDITRSDVNVFTPSDEHGGPTKQEILDWFGDKDGLFRPVLFLHNLYGNFTSLYYSDPSYTEFVEKLESAFVRSDYRQWVNQHKL